MLLVHGVHVVGTPGDELIVVEVQIALVTVLLALKTDEMWRRLASVRHG